MEKRELFSVDEDKRMYLTDDPDLLIAVYRDEITSGYGLKRGVVAGKGVINNRMTNLLMRYLEKHGIPTGLVEEIDEHETLVRRTQRYPIEVIVRNMVAGSLCTRLGLSEGTRLPKPVIEFCYKDEDLEDPMVNEYHIAAMGWASREELNQMADYALKANEALLSLFRSLNLELVDFKLEFGLASDGTMMISDEISPDTCRLWDAETHEKLDKDRFRRNMGDVEEAYREIWKRLAEGIEL